VRTIANMGLISSSKQMARAAKATARGKAGR
jgi:hypothetical protein